MLDCVLVVAMGLATLASPSLLERGEAELQRGELRKAGESFAAHYRSLPPAQRASPVGEYVVMYAADVFDRAWAEHADVDDLRASRALLHAFLRDVELVHGEAKPALTGKAQAKLEELDRTIDEAIAARTTEPEPEPEPEPESTEEPPPPRPPIDPIPNPQPPPPTHDVDQPDRLGVALLAVGATVAVGGIAMLAAGLAQATAKRAQARIDDRCEADGATAAECDRAKDTDAARAFIADAERSDRNVALGSIAPLLVGTGLLIGGGVRLHRARKTTARIGWGSWARRDGGGVVVSGSF